jgi:hypothetical protein
VALANSTLDELLAVEQRQGFTFTAAAVGDGSWQPRDGSVSRAALMHDGTVTGGAIATDDVVGGARNNYDGETAHRVDVLAQLHGSRLLYIFDSTSPVQAGEHFRRATTATRAKMECGEWLASTVGFEQRQHAIVYWWSKSHRGHLPEAAADALANEFLAQDDPTPVPCVPGRHVSARGYAKASERDLMLSASNLFMVREHYQRGDAIRAGEGDADALRHAKLCELHCLRVLRLRDDHARLMKSRSFSSAKALSVGAELSRTLCPCGGGVQDRSHLLWDCQLPRVAQIRRVRLLPACRALRERLDVCEPVSGQHAIARACCRALEEGKRPASMGVATIGLAGGAVLDDAATVLAAERHLLGVVVQPEVTAGLARALRCAKPMLAAVADMLQACERASECLIGRVFAQHRARQQLRMAFDWVRADAFVDRQDRPALATVVRGTPRVKASTIRPSVCAQMVTSPHSFGGPVAQQALAADDGGVAVAQMAVQMRRAASAAAARAADALVLAQALEAALQDHFPTRAIRVLRLGRPHIRRCQRMLLLPCARRLLLSCGS